MDQDPVKRLKHEDSIKRIEELKRQGYAVKKIITPEGLVIFKKKLNRRKMKHK